MCVRMCVCERDRQRITTVLQWEPLIKDNPRHHYIPNYETSTIFETKAWCTKNVQM